MEFLVVGACKEARKEVEEALWAIVVASAMDVGAVEEGIVNPGQGTIKLVAPSVGVE